MAVTARLVWARLLAYLRYFQQEGYEHLRFLKWANVRSLTDPAFWLSVGRLVARSRPAVGRRAWSFVAGRAAARRGCSPIRGARARFRSG